MQPDSSHSIPTRMLALSCVQSDGQLVAEPLFDMARLVGHSDKAMRDCLSRLVNKGHLIQLEGRGRSARYQASDTGVSLLNADVGWTAFAHRIDAGLEPWDNEWRLVSFEIPEKRRGARDALRSLLVELGASAMHSGLYVHAYDVSDFVRQLAAVVDVSASVVSFSTRSIKFGTNASDYDVVQRLWPLDQLADRYDTLEMRLVAIAAQASSQDGDKLAASMFSMILETEAVLRDDPLLPLELLPSDWPGSSARRAFLEALQATTKHSDLFKQSQMMQGYSAEIGQALNETSGVFWSRWFPRLIRSYQAQLPPAATTD